MAIVIAIAVDGVSDQERGSAMAAFTAFYDVAAQLLDRRWA